MSKVVVFYDEKFPYPGERPSAALFDKMGENVKVVGADGLASALAGEDVGCYVHAHGPYFPKAAWGAVLGFLRRSGGLVSLGGVPFRIPVYEEGGVWKNEPEQTAYHQQMQIHEALPVDTSKVATLVHHSDIPAFAGYESLFSVKPTYGLTFHVTRASDQPDQNGSSGPMDAHIYPLLKGITSDDREIAAPAILIENTKGPFAGGRWVLVNQELDSRFWNETGMKALVEWSKYAASGVTEIWLRPNYASYEPGDKAKLMIQLQTLHPENSDRWTFEVKVNGPGAAAWETRVEMEPSAVLSYARVQVPMAIEPGYYVVECHAQSSSGEVRMYRQGFWGFDAGLLADGTPITVSRDYFVKDGRPMPIVGMTYMSSDVARKFLLIPNASVWDRDMAQMRKAGINYIRTGIWTAWRSVMFVDGHPYEEVLRAIDAFIMTAKKHDIHVTFNFFAFTPETWEGVNPYLDPRSVEAQKRFIAAIVSRHKQTMNIDWDLINEPSMFDPKRIFAGPRSSRDSFERAAWVEWLKERHGSIRTLQERWNMTPEQLPDFSAAKLPEPWEMNMSTTESNPKKGGPWLDYTLFTMEMHNRWARELTAAIKTIAPNQLVTVGQDEGLVSQRPSPFFYAEAVDYTTVHSWWQMDQLVWDGIFTKAPDKPNVIQETGIMYVETANGRAKRSEEELRNILERKYAYAFAAGGAGAVQWIWNINHYMDNINESNIGALRSDGTEKPEAEVSYDFGAFMAQIRDLFEDRALEDMVVVFPYSNDFSVRKFATEATANVSRLLNYEMKVPFRALGEYHLESLADEPPKLIVVPSAHNFSDEALERIVSHVKEHGGVLLFTGPLSLDAYWRPGARFADVIGPTTLANVVREERIDIGGKTYPVAFDRSRIAELNKELPSSAASGYAAGSAPRVEEYALGKGRLIWSPMPIELNARKESTRALYEHVLAAAGVGPELAWSTGADDYGVYGRKLTFKNGALFIFVSEAAYASNIEVRDPATGASYVFRVESERTVMFTADRAGNITAVYRPHEVTVERK